MEQNGTGNGWLIFYTNSYKDHCYIYLWIFKKNFAFKSYTFESDFKINKNKVYDLL